MPQARTVSKIRRRILPYVFLLYIVAFLDRANVAFAKINMSADLGFSEAAFGFGAGIFFIGYFLLEIPGALIVERWSARKWIARILFTWGLCTVLVGFVRTPPEFYAARFLLGCAEAGFFPGIIIYLSHWFPREERAKAIAGLIMGVPVSQVIGSPLSALILQLNWFGLAGWRWVFILEGLPAIILGFVTLRYLTDRPRQAQWLEPDEREWLQSTLDAERARKNTGLSIWQTMRQRNILLLAFAQSCANIGTYAYQLWLPTLIRNASLATVTWATALTAVPFAAAVIGLRVVSRSSDRSGERRWHAAIPLWLAGFFFFLSGRPEQPAALILLWLTLTGLVAYAWPPPFWSLPTTILGDSAAATAAGFINSIGNLGGFVGPYVVGVLLTSGYAMPTAMAFVAAGFGLAGALVMAIRLSPSQSHTPPPPPARQ